MQTKSMSSSDTSNWNSSTLLYTLRGFKFITVGSSRACRHLFDLLIVFRFFCFAAVLGLCCLSDVLTVIGLSKQSGIWFSLSVELKEISHPSYCPIGKNSSSGSPFVEGGLGSPSNKNPKGWSCFVLECCSCSFVWAGQISYILASSPDCGFC